MLRIAAAALFALLAFGTSVNAEPALVEPVSPGQYTPVSDSSATALTPPVGATYAVVCVEGSDHRYTWDGTTAPTTSVGAKLSQGSCLPLQGYPVIAAFKIIAVTTGGRAYGQLRLRVDRR